ncbi:MAG: hypothetical protein COA67_11880 [Lutibacter sp.]|nr:MAG: hypothetical protein COA67_11880 [Lutibacter sp.]
MKKMKKFSLILLLFSCAFINAQFDNYKIKNLDVNTEYSDFGVTYLGDSTAIYASTKRVENTIRRKKWKQNQQPYLELYSGNLTSEGEINDSENFSEVINSKYHESNVAFTKDGKTVYFSRNNAIDGRKLIKAKAGEHEDWGTIQLYKATITDNGEWTAITAMPFNNDNYSTGHPSLNKEENKLYFTSDMPNGYGLTDIYVVDVNSDDTYGEPQNLGGSINTSGKEMFPYISDTNELYFSTDGHLTGYGNLDVYVSDLNKDILEEPKNLGRPINSNKDDFAFAYQSGKKTGHFSSNRDGGKGDDDIYYFEELKPLEKEPMVCAQVAKGVVRDKNSGALLPKAIVTLYKDGEKVESVVVGNDAVFEFVVACEANYKVVGEKKTYTPDDEEFITSNEADLELSLSLILVDDDFIVSGDKLLIKIDPIYFDLDKSFIRPDAAIELEKVIRVMKKYPGLIIEGGSHTDSRASDKYNEALSERRAKSTVNWIISKGGITWDKISAKGYGEYQPVNGCVDNVKCSEVEHQLNRRTEFVIKNPEILSR